MAKGMNSRLFLQIVALISIAILMMVLMKCAMKKCSIMGKYSKCTSCTTQRR